MTSRALAARRKRVLSANNRVGFGVLALSACLSFVFAGMISYLTLYHLPVWLTWGGDQLFTHFRSITERPVVRNILSATNLTLNEFQSNHLGLKVPVVLSAPSARCNRATMLNFLAAKRANFVSSRITSSIPGVVLIEEVETSISDFRKRSANPDVVTLEESEFFWSQLLGIDDQFAQEWLYGCAPELMQGGKEFIDSFDANEVAGFSGSLIGRGTNFRLADRGFLNIVIEGTQRWLLIKADRVPPQGIHQNESVSSWLASVYPNVTTEFTPTEALLRPGDMLFVPEGYLFGFESASNISTSMVKYRTHEVGEEQHLIFEAARRFSRQDLKGAENLLRKTLSQDSGSTYIALHQLGRVLEAQGDLEAAEEQYRRSVLKNRRTGYSFERIASIQFAKKDYKGAAHTIRLASKNKAITDSLISLNETVQFYLI